MPQIEQINTYASQVFWLVISFAALFFILRAVALPKIQTALEARREKIEGDLDKASSLKREAEDILAEYDASVAGARTEAQAIVRQVSDDMKSKAATEQQAIGKRLADEIREAEGRILRARDDALANIQPVSAEVAQTAVERLIGVKIDTGSAEQAVKSARSES